MLQVCVASCSECGARTTNEDALAVRESGPGWYAVLADGAGGHRLGAEAARRAVHRFEACLNEATLPWTPEVLTHAVLVAHDDVCRGQPANQAQRMHTTLVALCVDVQRGFALWTHVGDSRLYRMRNGRIDVVTRDDSVVHRLLEAGLLTAQQVERHPRKNQLAAALGMDDVLEPHTVPATPLKAGDAFLLCSDGWWGGAGDECIAETLCEADSPGQWLQAMRKRIESRDAADQDNFSAIALWVRDSAESTRAMPL